MNLIFRLLSVILGAWRRPKLGVNEVFALSFRVWPLDLDLNLHMTNSRYLALMDLGRVDMLLRSGVWRQMHRQKLGMVLGGAALRFRRPVAPFVRFSLATNVLGWDERWIYVQQVFSVPEGVACGAVVRAAFTKEGRLVPPTTVLNAVPQQDPPSWTKEWAEVESAFAG
ncbi:thioesterase family protein [Acidocella sp.]|uniref:thioesterase family protein n=1 Tax=Acidocella sp. TaxID=50710 RepID=UPI0026284909|nr:thioesterase family protein [Acidocella sp.]